MNDPIISKHGRNPEIDPEIAETICINEKGGVKTFRSRALVGWSHQDDTLNGRRSGKVWCWVSEGGAAFQVYDQHFNRSEKAGQVRFCGVANFTMIRMFHPYWSLNGQPPRDMRSSDKSWCRRRYNELMRKHDQNQATDEDTEDSSDSNDDRRKRRRAPKRSTGRKPATAKNRKTKPAVTVRDRSNRPSSSENDRWAIPDGSSESGSSEQPLTSRRKRQRRAIDTSDEESDGSLNVRPRARTRDVPVKEEAPATEPNLTADTENYDGIEVPALPILKTPWNSKQGETIDLDAAKEDNGDVDKVGPGKGDGADDDNSESGRLDRNNDKNHNGENSDSDRSDTSDED